MKKGICFFLAAVIVVSAVFAPMIKVKALTEEESYLVIADKYCSAMTNKEVSVSFSEYELPAEYAEKLYYYVLVTNPSLYYVVPEYNPEKATFSADGKYLDAYEFEYILTDTEQMDKNLDSVISAIADEIFAPAMHTVDMLLAIHEYIASNVDKPESRENITDDMLCSSVYGAAVYGCADSRGYALLFKVLAEKYTGSECILLSDDSYSVYWNMYRLGTNWYNIDVYSDDLECVYSDVNDNITDSYIFGNGISHAYFLVTTSGLISSGHVQGEALTYSPTPVAETDTIRIRIWSIVMSKMCYYDGYWYYISTQNNDEIVKRSTSVVLEQSVEITAAEFENAIIGFTLYNGSIYVAESFIDYDEDNDIIKEIFYRVHKCSPEGTNSEMLFSSSENEYVIGLCDRDGNAYYELYNIATREYEYVRISATKADGKMNVNTRDEYICGFYIGSTLSDLVSDLSSTGIVSKYDAYNSISVFDGENQVVDLNSKLLSGMTVKLADETVYTIVLTGDMDANGKFNILDIMTVLNAIGAEDNLTVIQRYAADYAADGSINIADAALMVGDLLPRTPQDEYSTKEYRLAYETDRVKLVGRSMLDTPGISCDWTASGIEFTANCYGDITLHARGDGGEANVAYFTVYIDGVRQDERIQIDTTVGKISNVVIAKDLPIGTHTIRLLKQSYVKHSRLTLIGVHMDGTLSYTAPAENEHYIEFIGDSITCGHGILGSTGNPVDMDGTATYAFMTAETLGADYSMVSVDGIGVVKGYQTEKMNDIYRYTCKYRDESALYNFARTPDVVVINLGTNDATKSADIEEYKAGVTELINSVRQSYGENVTIIWAYNSMRADYNEYTKAAIDAMGGETAGIYMVELEKNASGGNGHPSADAHIRDAEILSEYITQKGFLN